MILDRRPPSAVTSGPRSSKLADGSSCELPGLRGDIVPVPGAVRGDPGIWRSPDLLRDMIRAFASKKSQTVTARLIVRRVHYLTKQAAAGQADLFRAWRYHAVFTDSPARPAGGYPGPRPSPGPCTAQGADPLAPQASVRAVRAERDGGSPPGRRTQAARRAGARAARVGSPHGTQETQDAHRLRGMP
jgi:hypothetical protein